MTLNFICKSCKEDATFKSSAISRYELSDGKEEIQQTCNHCHTNQSIHVNKVYASPEKSKLLYAFLALLIVAGLLIYFVFQAGYIATITIGLPMAIYGILRNESEKKISTFNKFYI